MVVRLVLCSVIQVMDYVKVFVLCFASSQQQVHDINLLYEFGVKFGVNEVVFSLCMGVFVDIYFIYLPKYIDGNT